jgi:tetratricopeptide (TPR) repeat protein
VYFSEDQKRPLNSFAQSQESFKLPKFIGSRKEAKENELFLHRARVICVYPIKQKEKTSMIKHPLLLTSVTLAVLSLAVLSNARQAFACIWDSNTIKDELQSQDLPLFQLITGQFPHHGEAFYRRQAQRSLASLKSKPNDPEALNELGAAYTKLGRYDQALVSFVKLQKIKPGKYETLSNLGVLHKKMGQYDKAAKYIASALKIKAEGHMGLGDWYLKMLQYKASTAKSKTQPTSNFLGKAYTSSFYSWKIKDQKSFFANIKAMIRNDRRFADIYVVLGDYLQRNYRARNQALWCYVRALDLGHKNPAAIKNRIKKIHDHWRNAIKHSARGRRVLESIDKSIAGIKRELSQRQDWLKQFKEIEAALLAKSSDVDFAAVLAVMRSKSIGIAPANEHGILTLKSAKGALPKSKHRPSWGAPGSAKRPG